VAREEVKSLEVYEIGPTLTFSMGPQHPGTGHFRMVITVVGDTVVRCDPDPGFVHRGEEKMCEYKTWITNIPHLERPAILDAAGMVYPYILAVERLMGIEPPERAKYLRVIMAELQRICSHLYWLGLMGVFAGHATMYMWCFGDREYLVDLTQLIGGQRITHSYFVPGGVRNDAPSKVPRELVKNFRTYYRMMLGKDYPGGEVPEDFRKYVLAVCDFFDTRLDEYYPMLLDSPIFIYRTKGVGVLKREDAISLGVVGPVLRGSGVKSDTRIDEPYDAYPYIKFNVPTMDGCDSYSRMMVGYYEMKESVRIIKQAIEQMPEGPVKLKQHPVTIKVPAGEVFASAEAARGQCSFYIRSDGTDRPYRVKICSPSFRNLIAMPYLIKDVRIADIPIIYWSLNYWPVECDR